MVAVGELDELDFRVLGVVLLQIGEELLVIARVNGRQNAVGTLCEHRKHPVVNVIVNQDNPSLGTSNEVGDIRPRIPDTTCLEDLLGEKLRGLFFDFFENDTNLLVGFYLVLLDIENALDYLRVVVDELWNHGESSHDADVDFHSCVRS